MDWWPKSVRLLWDFRPTQISLRKRYLTESSTAMESQAVTMDALEARATEARASLAPSGRT
jgi:hypothetical protein